MKSEFPDVVTARARPPGGFPCCDALERLAKIRPMPGFLRIPSVEQRQDQVIVHADLPASEVARLLRNPRNIEMRIRAASGLGGLPRANERRRNYFVTPAGIAENVAQLVAPARSAPGIAKHLDPFVKCDANGIVGLDIFREAKTEGISGVFRLERAEKLVPDDQSSSVVPVDVAGIRAVMHAMMGRRIENSFERAKRTHQLSVNPELVEQADGFHGHDHHRSEADNGQPEPENEAHKAAGPGLAQSGRQVVALGRVMHHMRGPEQAALVAGAVEPVVAEFIAEKEQRPSPPLESNVKNRKA